MSIASSQPMGIKRRPPFYGPDQRYVPPIDDDVVVPDPLPGHLELPDENDEIVENFREAPQGQILDQGIWPTLERLHPDRHFALGHDCGIYWKLSRPPLYRGEVCPDWCYIPGVPPLLDGHYRRSYVLWKEHVKPTVLIEYASDDGKKSATVALTRASSGSMNRPFRAHITQFSSSRPANWKFTSCNADDIGGWHPTNGAIIGSSPWAPTLASGTDSFRARRRRGYDGTTHKGISCP